MVFRPTYRQPALHHDPSPHGSSRAVTAIVASMLRLGIRDFRNASAAHRVRTAGPRRELWALRVTGWLTPAQIADINRKVHALRDAVGQPRAEGKLYAITVLLTPLQHRARKGRR